MYAHQQSTLDAIAEHFKNDADVIALLLAGSITKGWAREDSDVDIVIVKTPEAYQKHLGSRDLTYYNPDVATYEGGYVDGKFVDKQFLLDVLDHGSEVAKSAFLGAKVVFSHDPEIPAMVAKIAQYPEDTRIEKIHTFAGQLIVWTWYIGEAEKRNDRYLLLQSVTEMVLFGSRLMLAHNRLLFPYHKWMRRQLEQCEELPENYFELMDSLLENPCRETAEVYTKTLLEFRDWGVSFDDAMRRFLTDREWNWRAGKPTIHDW